MASEALDFLRSTGEFADRGAGRPKLILLAIRMPRVDGLEVLRYITQTDSLKSIPVGMLTSSAEERDIVQSYALDANSFIVKPVDTEEFYCAVTSLGMYWMLVNKITASFRGEH